MKIKGESQLPANLVIGSRMGQKNIDLVFPIGTVYSIQRRVPPKRVISELFSNFIIKI